MNALVGLELLKKSGDKYALTPESEAFLVSNKPGTLAGFFSMNRVRMMQLWMKLDEIVRTGRPAEARNQEGPGTEFFSELVENIIPMSYGSAQALAEHLKLADATNQVRVLDLACGLGNLGNCPGAKIAASASDGGRLGWNDSDNQTHHAKIWRGRSFQIYRR